MRKTTQLVLLFSLMAISSQARTYVQSISEGNVYDMSYCDDEIFRRPDPFYVTGSAAYSLPPELAKVSMGLDVLKPTAKEALSTSATIMDAAIKAIKALGVIDEEIQTANLQISEQWDYSYDEPNRKSIRTFKGYQVTQTLSITTKLVDQAGAIIDAGISNQMNRVDSVSFDAKPATIKAIKDSLIQNAIDDAHAKAMKALNAVNYTIESVKSVSLNDFVFYFPTVSSVYKQYSQEANTNVFAETQIISMSATVGFIISDLSH